MIDSIPNENSDEEAKNPIGEPVHYLEIDHGKEPKDGIALCLSGDTKTLIPDHQTKEIEEAINKL